MITSRRKWILIGLIFHATFFCRALYADTLPTAKDTSKTVRDSTQIGYSIPQDKLIQLGDVDLAKWLRFLPHWWVSRMPQFGQPQYAQKLGTPVWMPSIRVSRADFRDPVFGLRDLTFFPTIRIAAIHTPPSSYTPMDLSTHGLELQYEDVRAKRPFSQVFYHAGDNGLSEVDILFQRGFARGIHFQATGNFFKYRGIYSNSSVDNFTFSTNIRIPLTRSIEANYFLQTHKIEAGYPGHISENYKVRFFSLHRKVRHYVHWISITDSVNEHYSRELTLQLSADRKWYEATQTYFEANNFWMNGALALHRSFGSSHSTVGINVQSVIMRVRSLPEQREFPVGIFLHHLKQLHNESGLSGTFRFLYHDHTWQELQAELRANHQFHSNQKAALSVFYHQQPPPFGWRNNVIVPFENQPWIFSPELSDSLFLSDNAPTHSARVLGLEYFHDWEPSGQLGVENSLFLQKASHVSFPDLGEQFARKIVESPDYLTAGFFGELRYTISDQLEIVSGYQWARITKKQNPEFAEIPEHRFWARIHLYRPLFKQNVLAHAFLNIEQIGARQSVGYSFDARQWFIANLPSQTLLNVKLWFQIGDADIFFYWYNLLNQTFSYRALKPIPGWQFQFGIRWKFWD